MNIASKVFNLLSPLHNCEAVTITLCRLLKVPVTRSTIKKELEGHPDFPSLLTICEVLTGFGIANLATKIDATQIMKLPTPLIAHVQINRDKYFCVITEANQNSIGYTDPVSNKKVVTSLDEFKVIFTGYVLLAEASESAGEKEYAKHLWEEKRQNISKLSAALLIPFITLLSCTIAFYNNGAASTFAITYTLLTLVGVIVGSLLLWYEVDKHNPALQEICSAGNKTNCNAILSSKASKVFGISWSAIGFSYFTGSLLSLLLVNVFYLPVLSILSWLNLFTLPYIIFSIYYQWKIVKEWCVLCLSIQCILLLQFYVAFFGRFHSTILSGNINALEISILTISFAIPYLIVSILMPTLNKSKDNKKNKIELQRLKHNTQIFEALLGKQKAIQEPTGLGIIIGNQNAKFKLIKVCNPYCGPCATAHPIIEELVANNPDVQVQILFTATGEDSDYKTPPTRHMLAIAEKGDEEITKKALDDWYLAKEKNYETFAAKYPLNGELKAQGDKIKAMDDWCHKTNIEFTPTFFVNGYQLPKMYSLSDLKYFLSV